MIALLEGIIDGGDINAVAVVLEMLRTAKRRQRVAFDIYGLGLDPDLIKRLLIVAWG